MDKVAESKKRMMENYGSVAELMEGLAESNGRVTESNERVTEST
jgi:hypothetical protein